MFGGDFGYFLSDILKICSISLEFCDIGFFSLILLKIYTVILILHIMKPYLYLEKIQLISFENKVVK